MQYQHRSAVYDHCAVILEAMVSRSEYETEVSAYAIRGALDADGLIDEKGNVE